MKQLIQNVDEEAVTDQDLDDIRKSGCINCGEGYSDTVALLFVRLNGSTKLRWWHAHHCTKRALR